MTALQSPPATKDQRLRGGWLWVGRLAALIGMATNIVPFAIGLPAALRNLTSLESVILERWQTVELADALQNLGLSVSFLVWLIIIVDALILISFLGVALLLFIRYSNRWFGLIVPYILVGLGIGTAATGIEAFNVVETFPQALSAPTQFIGTLIWPAFIVSVFLFPDGRPVPRWTWIFIPIAPLMFVAIFLLFQDTIPDWTGAVLFATVLAGLASQIYRYAKVSTASQRQQTKWVLFGLSLFVFTLFISYLGFGNSPGQRLLFTIFVDVILRGLVSSFLPLALAISLTRYRLWDVDELVSRALVYGLLTAFFAAIFAASAALVNQLSLTFFGEQSGALAPVVSAAIVAAFFQPTRKRLEEWIDKRFYPQKKEMIAGLVETDPSFWPFITMSKLLDSSLAHIAEHLNTKPLAAFLVSGDKFKPTAALGIQVSKLGALILTKKQLDEFKKKRVAAIENDGSFVALVPLSIPAKNKGLVGTIALGPRSNGRGYSGEDLKTLVELGGKIALSIHAIRVRTGKGSK